MPLTAVPFRLPEPFALPDAWLAQFQGTTTHEMTLFLTSFLLNQDFADWVSIQGRDLTPLAQTPLVKGLPASQELDGFAQQAMENSSSLLIMGDLDGQPAGFLYAVPLLANGQARGALMLHRPPAAGPLNHDQPAIVNALSEFLGSRL